MLITPADAHAPHAERFLLRRRETTTATVFSGIGYHDVVFRALHLGRPIGHPVALVEPGGVDADVGVFGFVFGLTAACAMDSNCSRCGARKEAAVELAPCCEGPDFYESMIYESMI